MNQIEHSQTKGLGTLKEIQDWEKSHKSAYIADDMGGYIEVMPARTLDDDNSLSNEEFLYMLAVNATAYSVISLQFSNREDIIKLRDYLTRFIEKQEFWVEK